MRSLVLVLLVSSLAGCFGGSDDPDPEPTPTPEPVEQGNETVDPPLGFTLVWSATNTTGDAPFTTNVSLSSPDLDANATVNWTVQVYAVLANATNGTADNATTNSTIEPIFELSGTGLPANTSVTIPVAGTFEAVAFADAGEFGLANATLTLEVTEAAVVTGPPLFFDGAENGTDQWTTSATFEGAVPATVFGWGPSSDEAHTDGNSWYSDYPDVYTASLTSIPILIPDDGAEHTLSFWVKGSSEAGIDTMTASVGPEGEMRTAGTFSEEVADWEYHEVSLKGFEGLEIMIDFTFVTDEGCSAAGDFPGLCGGGPFIGWYVDDIEVR